MSIGQVNLKRQTLRLPTDIKRLRIEDRHAINLQPSQMILLVDICLTGTLKIGQSLTLHILGTTKEKCCKGR